MNIPKRLQPLYNGWMAISHWIGLVMSSIILSMIWLIVFGLYAIVLKTVALFQKKTIKTSYWWDVSEEQGDFQHQF